MAIEGLEPTDAADAAALWEATGLTTPWNDPLADFERALRGPTSAVLGMREDGRLVGTAMVGHDGHRGWVYYLAVDRAGRARASGRRSWPPRRPGCSGPVP
jgi:hypothetical protein